MVKVWCRLDHAQIFLIKRSKNLLFSVNARIPLLLGGSTTSWLVDHKWVTSPCPHLPQPSAGLTLSNYEFKTNSRPCAPTTPTPMMKLPPGWRSSHPGGGWGREDHLLLNLSWSWTPARSRRCITALFSSALQRWAEMTALKTDHLTGPALGSSWWRSWDGVSTSSGG